MIKNPFAKYDFSNPFGTDAMKRSRNLFGVHTTPRDWKHGARDIPFGMGAASLYVDGTDGNDSNDGESWITAKKTIQETVDTADSWTQIFIKAGTYIENVNIPAAKDSITLIGERPTGTIIRPSSSYAIYLQGESCSVYNLTAIGAAVGLGAGMYITGDYVNVQNCIVGNSVADHLSGKGLYCGSEYGRITNVSLHQTDLAKYGIQIDNNNITVSDCYLKNAYTYAILFGSGYSWNRIYANTIVDAGTYGIYCSGASYNAAYHNNLISSSVYDAIGGNAHKFFENFYDDHTNIDNGHGIATEPYAFTGGSDPRPVATRDGWNSISILRSLLRKKTAAQTSQAATDANGTAWVDLKTIAPTTSDIELHRLKMTTAGSWAGTAKYRIIIGATKVYPFPADKNIDSGNIEDLIFPINVQINETCKIQFRSDNAGDGAGETVALNQLDYALVL